MNKIAYMTCVLSLAFTMQACDDFLDSFPQDTVTNENFWKSKEGCRQGVSRYLCITTS